MIASRSRLARPRVLSFSSRVAWNDGHIVPSRFFRQAPTPAHSSAAGSRPPSAEKSNVVATRGRHVARSIAQVRRQRRRIDDLAGIQQVERVERSLQLPKCLVEHGSIHLLLKWTTDQAVAMLARKRTTVLEHQLGDFLGDRLEFPHALLGLEVDHRPHVQAADRGMRIDAGRRPVPRDDLQELGDVVAQVLGSDGRVLDERDRLGIPFLGHRQPQRHRAQLPDACLGGGIGDGKLVIAKAALPQLASRGRRAGAAARRPGRRTARSGGWPRDRLGGSRGAGSPRD